MKMRLACDYYPNHVPKEQWPLDMQRMKECGIDLFRLLCFDWTAIEPEEGVWRFDWVREVVELAGTYGIQVQLTIPTAGQPPWMMLNYPETTAHGTMTPGFRREYCPVSSLYRQYCRTLTARIVDEVGGYDNIWGYQIDNELGFNISKSPDAYERWIEWLKQRHGSDIGDLNEGWCLKFWSREYTDWSQVQWEHKGSPESRYDLKHFYSDVITEFMENILEVLRDKAPDKVISTNYMANFDMIDYWRMSRNLDVVGYDYYKWIFTLEGGALAEDLMRSLKQKKHWRFESGCDACLPTDWLVLQTLKGWARGAAGDMRFPWQQFRGGDEQELNALIDAAGRKTRSWEATRISSEIIQSLPELEMSDFNARVAVVNNYKCGWASQCFHRYLTQNLVEGVYKSLFRLGTLCDVVSEESDFSPYDVVFFPPHLLIDDALARHLEDFVSKGGTVVAMPMSFTHTPKVQLWDQPPPAGATGLFGAEMMEDHPDRNDLDNDSNILGNDLHSMTVVKPVGRLTYRLSSDVLPELEGTAGERWFTRLQAYEDTEVLARYEEGPYQTEVAITRKRHPGGGSAWLLGTFLDESIQRVLFKKILDEANVEQIPPETAGVEVVPTARFITYLNFTPDTQSEPAPGGKILFGEGKQDRIVLPPYGFAVVER